MRDKLAYGGSSRSLRILMVACLLWLCLGAAGRWSPGAPTQTAQIAQAHSSQIALPAIPLLPATLASLTVTQVPSFAVTLDGADQTVSASLVLQVIDPLGALLGCNLQITSTQFGVSGGAHTLATGAARISALSWQCAGLNLCTILPTVTVSSLVSIPAGASAPTPVKFFDAAIGTGIGTFVITATITVTLPANTYAGAYSSAFTVLIADGP